MKYKKGIDFIIVSYCKQDFVRLCVKSINQYIGNIDHTINIVVNYLDKDKEINLHREIFKNNPNVNIIEGVDQSKTTHIGPKGEFTQSKTWIGKIDNCEVASGSKYAELANTIGIKKGQRELTSGGFYSMGIALPLAIGASATDKNAQVIAITGDGSIELNIQELRTLSQNNFDVKLFIINNGGYASIRKSQDEIIGGGRYTDDEEVLNFKKVASAFELDFEILENYKNLETDLKRVLNKKGPMLIEVVCDSQQEIIEPFELLN